MADFEVPDDIRFNRGAIANPAAFAAEAGAKGWLYLCGTEFASMEGGMSYDQVLDSVGESENIVSDPPVDFTVDLVKQHLEAIERLPRPTLVTCRMGPRSSVSVYVYAGLKAGATADEVLAKADADGAPFAGMEPYRELVRQAMDQLEAP
jgi:hypothetical protein